MRGSERTLQLIMYHQVFFFFAFLRFWTMSGPYTSARLQVRMYNAQMQWGASTCSVTALTPLGQVFSITSNTLDKARAPLMVFVRMVVVLLKKLWDRAFPLGKDIHP